MLPHSDLVSLFVRRVRWNANNRIRLVRRDDCDIDPENACFEVTEQTSFRDMTRAIDSPRELRKAQFGFALDGFGSSAGRIEADRRGLRTGLSCSHARAAGESVHLNQSDSSTREPERCWYIDGTVFDWSNSPAPYWKRASAFSASLFPCAAAFRYHLTASL